MDNTLPQRRADDTRIVNIEQRLGTLERKVDENTEVTKKILDGINAFKILGAFAKWAAMVVGAVVAIKTGWNQLFTGR